MKGCKILYLGNDMEFDVPLLIVLGALFTIWANTLCIFTLNTVVFWYISAAACVPIILSTVIILVSTALALYYGVKRNNPKLVRCWYIVKIIECILISVAFTIHCVNLFGWHPSVAIFAGLPLLPFGIYLIVCVKKIYKNMISPPSIYKEMIIEQPTVAKA